MTNVDAPAPQRIKGIDDEGAPLWIRLFFELQRRLFGAVLEPTRVWARAPAAMRGFVHLFAAVDRAASPIEASLRSLVMAKVSQVNACAFRTDIHQSTMLKRGISIEKAEALSEYESSCLFSEKERAALRYAVAIVRGDVTDAVFARLELFFDADAIVELTALVALQDASSKFNSALSIPAQGFCRVPPKR